MHEEPSLHTGVHTPMYLLTEAHKNIAFSLICVNQKPVVLTREKQIMFSL